MSTPRIIAGTTTPPGISRTPGPPPGNTATAPPGNTTGPSRNTTAPPGNTAGPPPGNTATLPSRNTWAAGRPVPIRLPVPLISPASAPRRITCPSQPDRGTVAIRPQEAPFPRRITAGPFHPRTSWGGLLNPFRTAPQPGT